MTIQTLRDVQTKHGRLVATRRIWIASNGHKVTVETDACINSRSTYGDRLWAYSRVLYRCECGSQYQAPGTPKKAELANHDTWQTQAQIEQVAAVLQDQGRDTPKSFPWGCIDNRMDKPNN